MTEEKTKRGRPKTENAATSRVEVRITEEQQIHWSAQAARDGFIHAGNGNVSGWLKDLADRASGLKKD